MDIERYNFLAECEAEIKKYPKRFMDWGNSDNVILTPDGYKEQSSQYIPTFENLDKLYIYFQKEFNS